MTGFLQVADRLRFRLWRFRDAVHDRLRGKAHRQGVFSRIHAGNLWGDPHSVSGGGSSPAATRAIRRELPALFRRRGIRSVLDAPCGDFLWMREVVHALDRYVGVDIVPDLVARNASAYGSDAVSFLCADIVSDPLPAADLVLCRDGFIHLPTRLIRGALRNFRATRASCLLLTNDLITEPYHDIPAGSFRRINFRNPPFSFPEPLWILPEDAASGRQLCLWELQSLPVEPVA